MRIQYKIINVLCACVFILNLFIQSDNARSEVAPSQVMVDIYDPPMPVQILDKHYLIYELYLTNFYKHNISLESIEIKDKISGMPLLGFDKNSLQKMMQSTAQQKNTETEDDTILPAGALKIIYMMLPFNSENDIPKEVIHRLIFTKNKENNQAETVREEMNTLPLAIEKPMQIMISPPVKGDYWVAENGLSNTSLHRRAHYITNGQNYFAQRFAIDLVKIDLEGKTYSGNRNDNTNYYSYGKNVFAVARGTVVAVKDEIVDSHPQIDNQPSMSHYNPGNYIILELGRGIYAFYGHLKPGSLQVKVGQKVSEGQVLAQIGNSGDSTEPRLHFHIVDKPSYLSGNGQPFTLTEFWVRPSEAVQVGNKLEYRLKEAPEGIKRHTNQLLFENTVIKLRDDQEIISNQSFAPKRAI